MVTVDCANCKKKIELPSKMVKDMMNMGGKNGIEETQFFCSDDCEEAMYGKSSRLNL